MIAAITYSPTYTEPFAPPAFAKWTSPTSFITSVPGTRSACSCSAARWSSSSPLFAIVSASVSVTTSNKRRGYHTKYVSELSTKEIIPEGGSNVSEKTNHSVEGREGCRSVLLFYTVTRLQYLCTILPENKPT